MSSTDTAYKLHHDCQVKVVGFLITASESCQMSSASAQSQKQPVDMRSSRCGQSSGFSESVLKN